MSDDTSTNIARPEEDQAGLNAQRWALGEFVDSYATRDLRPVEQELINRHREALGGRVLELGCGSGRLTGYLSEISPEVLGIDISPAMVAHCRLAYPGAKFALGDLRELSGLQTAAYDVVVAGFNVLDVLADGGRREVLSDIRRLLAPDGLLIMSSHNRAYALQGTTKVRLRMRLLLGSPRTPLASIRGLPRRLANHGRLRRRQHVEDGYAVLNDEAHDFSVLHYYISRDAQELQMSECGYRFVECLDLDGLVVSPGEAARHCPELHYVARR